MAKHSKEHSFDKDMPISKQLQCVEIHKDKMWTWISFLYKELLKMNKKQNKKWWEWDGEEEWGRDMKGR